MKTFRLKLPNQLVAWVEKEAQRRGLSTSDVVREALVQYQRKQPSALELAADLVGSASSGLKDLSSNKDYLKGFGE